VAGMEQPTRTMRLQPLTLAEAKVFVGAHHSHHKAPIGGKFAIGVSEGEDILGVAIVGRPVARGFDNGWTAEVTRCCVKNGHKNVASMLYAACWRAARAMGYKRLITYTLMEEKGTSLKAAGFRCIGETKGGSWSCPSRPRIDKHPIGQKLLWEWNNPKGGA